MTDLSQVSDKLHSVKVFYDLSEFDTWLHSTLNASVFHEYCKIFISRSRSLSIFIDNKLYDVGLNDIVILNYLEYHKLLSHNNTHDGIMIVFNPLYIQDSHTTNTDLTACFYKRSEHFTHVRSPNRKQAIKIDSYIQAIAKYACSEEFGTDALKKVSLIELLILINGMYEVPGIVPHKSSSLSYQKTKPIIDYINENIHTDLSLELIAQKFFISKYHLCRIFKASTGHTVNEYINSRRVLKACELLREDFSITQVCEAVGIENPSHFIEIFKKMIGITPKKFTSEFRNNSKRG